MIYDEIAKIGRYKGISKWFDYAIDFLLHNNLEGLPLGKTFICEDHVFINVMEADTVKENTTSFEIHKKYWDVQIDIEGTELIQVGNKIGNVVDEFQEEIDFGTFFCEEYTNCIMGPGRFIVCMEEEPHRPTLEYDGCARVKKCVIKVEVENDVC